MVNKIVVYTMDGTASGMNGIGGPTSTDTSLGGAFPQKLASLLQAHDSTVWEWFPVDHKAYKCLTEGKPIRIPVKTAVDIVTANIATRPAGTKFVLSGLSFGTMPVGVLYNEFRYGNLQSRRNDLIGIIQFGDAMRPRGWSVPIKGGLDPGGQGVMNVPLTQTYGLSDALVKNPEWFYLSFAQKGDAAACVDLSGDALEVMDQLASFLYYGDTSSVLPGFTSGGIIGVAYEGLQRIKLSSFSSMPGLQWIGILASVVPVFMNWIGFVVAGIFNAFGFINIASQLNPHTQYDTPFTYNSMSGNSKGAVTLAYEWCLNNLPNIANPTTATAAGSKIAVYEAPGTNPTAPIYYPPVDVAKLPFYQGLDSNTFHYTLVQDYLNAIYPLTLSVQQGVAAVSAYITANPGKFILIGTSQGAMIMSKVYQSLMAGSLNYRLSDCLGVFLMGNPLRQSGRTFPGATAVAGHGMAPAWERLTNTTDLVWEFAQSGDPVCTNGDDAISVARQLIFEGLETRWFGALDVLGGILGVAQYAINEILAFLTPKVGDILESMAFYHNGYDKITYQPMAGDTRTGLQIILDQINTKYGPANRPDGWSTALTKPSS